LFIWGLLFKLLWFWAFWLTLLLALVLLVLFIEFKTWLGLGFSFLFCSFLLPVLPNKPPVVVPDWLLILFPNKTFFLFSSFFWFWLWVWFNGLLVLMVISFFFSSCSLGAPKRPNPNPPAGLFIPDWVCVFEIVFENKPGLFWLSIALFSFGFSCVWGLMLLVGLNKENGFPSLFFSAWEFWTLWVLVLLFCAPNKNVFDSLGLLLSLVLLFWKFPKAEFRAFEPRLPNKPPLLLLLALGAPNKVLLPFELFPNKEGPLFSEEEVLFVFELLLLDILPKSPCPWEFGFLSLILFPKREDVLLVLLRLEKIPPPPELCPCCWVFELKGLNY